jgi:FkbM family methyltransferase
MMTVQRMIARMAEWVPQSVKIALRGKSASPNRLANAIHSVLNHAPGEKYPVLTCGGVLEGYRMRVDWTKHRSFAYGTWEPEVVEVILSQVKPGMTVLDIGAHSGFYALLLSKLVGPTGKVIAFEPLPSNHRMLEENIGFNGVQNIEIRKEAVGERSGEIAFEVPDPNDSLVAGPVLASDPQGLISVRAVSLDDFLFERGLQVDFIKMDVEGAEGAILRGAQRTLGTFHPLMMVELHNMDKQTSRHPDAVFVEELGYQLRWLGEEGYTTHIYAQWPAKTTAHGV